MSKETAIEELARKQVVYNVPAMDDVVVRQDVEYYRSGDDCLIMDVYLPPETQTGAKLPAVILVAGYPFPSAMLKTWGPCISWARLIAASGMAAVFYENREPAADINRLLDFLGEHGESLNIDRDRIGLWSSSGNVPTALSLLRRGDTGSIKCAVCCYGYMLDSGGPDVVAAAAAEYGFANPCTGMSPEAIAGDIPLFIVRAGRDHFAGLNDTIEAFVAGAMQLNLPLTLVNHANGTHGFDFDDDSDASRAIVRQTLDFMRLHLI